MRLGVKMLNSSSVLNILQYLNQVRINPNDTATIMFQLVDLDLGGQRYIPLTGATMAIKLVSIDNANVLSKIPVNPFADDRSVWSFNLSAAETAIAAGVNMSVVLTQGADIKSATAEGAVIFNPQSNFSC
jgi:hypothetical protein